MRNVWKFFMTACLFAAVEGCHVSPGYTVDMETDSVALCKDVGAEKVKAAIAKGAANRDWRVIEEDDSRVRLLLDIRGKHEVVVDVFYTADSFRVKYVSSKNLDYDPSTKAIRRKYIQWVRNLKHDIRQTALSM